MLVYQRVIGGKMVVYPVDHQLTIELWINNMIWAGENMWIMESIWFKEEICGLGRENVWKTLIFMREFNYQQHYPPGFVPKWGTYLQQMGLLSREIWYLAEIRLVSESLWSWGLVFIHRMWNRYPPWCPIHPVTKKWSLADMIHHQHVARRYPWPM